MPAAAACRDCGGPFVPRFDVCSSKQYRDKILASPDEFIPGAADKVVVPDRRCIYCTRCTACRRAYWQTRLPDPVVQDMIDEDARWAASTAP